VLKVLGTNHARHILDSFTPVALNAGVWWWRDKPFTGSAAAAVGAIKGSDKPSARQPSAF